MAISSQNSILNQWAPPFTINSPKEGQVLVYDSFSRTFTNRAMPFSTGCGTMSGAVLDDLGDVAISSPENGDVLTYLNGQWINAVNFGGNNITGMNVGTGVGVFKDKVQTLLRFKSLLPGENVRLEEDPCMNTITIHVESGAGATDAFAFIKTESGNVAAENEDYINIFGNGSTISTAITSDRTLTIDWHAGISDLSDVSTTGDDVPMSGQVLEWDGFQWVPGDKMAIGSSYFIGLLDTPKSYLRQAGKVLAVKLDETGIEFVDLHGGAGAVTSVFGRMGNIVAAPNDYTASQVAFLPSSLVNSNNVQGAIDIVSVNLSTVAGLANTALQPGAPISSLTNNVGYMAGVITSPVVDDMLVWNGTSWVNTHTIYGGKF